MHDGVFFEDHGIPTATVISAEFVRAAAALGAVSPDSRVRNAIRSRIWVSLARTASISDSPSVASAISLRFSIRSDPSIARTCIS